jgi:hypothetical protein
MFGIQQKSQAINPHRASDSFVHEQNLGAKNKCNKKGLTA